MYYCSLFCICFIPARPRVLSSHIPKNFIIDKGKIKGYGTFFRKTVFHSALNRYFAGSMENNSSGLLDLTWCFSSAGGVFRQAFASVYFVPHKFTPNPYKCILTEYWRIARTKCPICKKTLNPRSFFYPLESLIIGMSAVHFTGFLVFFCLIGQLALPRF